MASIAPVYVDWRDCTDRPIKKGDAVLVRENAVAPVMVGIVENLYPEYREGEELVTRAQVEVHTTDGREVYPYPQNVLVIARGLIDRLTPEVEAEESAGE